MRIKELPLSDIHFIPSEYTDHLYHSIIRIGFSFPINLFFEHRTLHIPKKEFFIMCLKKSTLLHPLFEQILLKKYLPDFH